MGYVMFRFSDSFDEIIRFLEISAGLEYDDGCRFEAPSGAAQRIPATGTDC